MVLDIDHVTKVYANGVQANRDVTLSVQRGEVFGLLGPNGAGKTTLVSQILGLVAPTSGTIRIEGIDVVRRPAVARDACSYQPQSSVPIRGLTPMQAIELVGRIRGLERREARHRSEHLLGALELTEWRTRVVAELSGGVVRLVAFCMAAVAPGRIVILDEPTNDVDPLRRKLLWEQVRTLADAGSAVVLVTHNVLEAERCVDRLAIVDRGRVVGHGTPGTLKRDLGSALRLEVVFDPTAPVWEAPAFVTGGLVTGRRFIGDVRPADLSAAVAWGRRLQEDGVAEEFSIGPATLEDVYVRRVREERPREEARAAVVG